MVSSELPFLGHGIPLDIRTRYGVDVAVEDDLRSIMSFVLLEREAWFEDEVAFLQRVLPKGAHIADIGANVGVYSAALAHAAGPHGRVVAVEPHPVAGALLERNAAAALQAPIHAERRAVAAGAGRQSFSFGASSEMSSLVEGGGDIEVETVAVDTLIRELRWSQLDFMKIDVEGAELPVLAGAAGTLAETDPIVMIELVNSDVADFDRLKPLAAAGYSSYRHVPGLDILVPFSEESNFIGLNAFAVKPLRAAKLEAVGHLTQQLPTVSAADSTDPAELKDNLAKYFAGLAPALQIPATGRLWRQAFDDPQARDYLAGCADLLAARNEAHGPAVRAGLLERALVQLLAAVHVRPSPARLLSLLTCGAMSGNLAGCNAIAKPLVELATGDSDFAPDEPVMVPISHYERDCRSSDATAWLKAVIFHYCIERYRFSSFYMSEHVLQLVDRLYRLGYSTAGIERVRQLCALRLRRQLRPVASPIFDATDDSFLNRELWKRAIIG